MSANKNPKLQISDGKSGLEYTLDSPLISSGAICMFDVNCLSNLRLDNSIFLGSREISDNTKLQSELIKTFYNFKFPWTIFLSCKFLRAWDI